MRYMKPVRYLVLAITLGSVSGTASASPGYAAGFKAGMTFACNSCASATNSAMMTIDAAITASETTILAATGVAPPNPMVGFPALSDTISGSTGQQTDQLVNALEVFTKSIRSEIRNLPAYHAELESNTKLVQGEFIGDKQSCAAVNYGTAQGEQGASSLATGFRFLQGASLESGSGGSGSNGGSGSGSNLGAGIDATMAPDKAASALINNLSEQANARIRQQLRTLRENADAPDASAAALLKPSLLLSQDSLVLSEDEDDTGLSDSERMDLLMQYLVADRPSAERFLESAASSPAMMNAAAEESIVTMESSLAMAVLDKMIKGRRKQASSLGSEEYLREVMADQDPSGAASDDEFIYLTTHYRINDPAWIAKIELSEDYATKQLAQMEAEHIALKYKRWSLKRDINLMLSQILANQLEEERP